MPAAVVQLHRCGSVPPAEVLRLGLRTTRQALGDPAGADVHHRAVGLSADLGPSCRPSSRGSAVCTAPALICGRARWRSAASAGWCSAQRLTTTASATAGRPTPTARPSPIGAPTPPKKKAGPKGRLTQLHFQCSALGAECFSSTRSWCSKRHCQHGHQRMAQSSTAFRPSQSLTASPLRSCKAHKRMAGL